MCRQIGTTSPVTIFLMMLTTTLMAADEGRVLFKFDNPEAAKPWQTSTTA